MINAYSVLFDHWDGEFPINVVKIAEKCGLSVDLEDKYQLLSNKITVRGRDGVHRQRFAIAHLLGHYCLGHGDKEDGVNNFSTKAIGQEAEANKFAVELMMPEIAVEHLVYEAGMTSLTELASIFLVSTVAMQYRLKQLGLL